jgi:fatty-acyl-CoA synthase
VQAERCTGLHGVPTMFIAELDHPRFAEFDLQPAHRHHGRLALPDRGDEARGGADAHARGHHRLRHDRDQPGELPERAPTTPLDKRVSTVGQVQPHLEVKIVDPDTGAVVPRGSPASSAPAAIR